MRAPMASEGLRSRAALVAILGLIFGAILILWLGASTDIDLRLADAAFNRATQSFPLQHAWLTEKFNHVILKSMLSAVGASIVVLALWDAYRPYKSWQASRRVGMRVTAMSAVMVPSVISLLKHASASHCPWDLQRYGGTEPYVRLLEWMPAGIAPGHCLPGGHASSALWLLAIAAFWWPHRPRTAVAVAVAMLMFGGAVGWLQQLRGAHFLTHTLWSAWIACALVFAIYLFNTRGLARLRAMRYSSVPAAIEQTIR
ncbi:phosphatase PAP2 family protein [Massilia endophytica]|uniref:phosphatase PAP2 family protein n=1 Tax=Massilia endophytica TaxID=2899220 RepID=UPI001E42F876|nr:phosphatase PAP2 family protein [Massilia endophytica]UGQ47730.1 phosphatase PAP2 family protein [Massilia endophytica]